MSIFIGISLLAAFSYYLWKRCKSVPKNNHSVTQTPPSQTLDDGFYCMMTVSGHCKSGYITKQNKTLNN